MTMHPPGFLLSEIRRLQRTYPAHKLPNIIAKYVEERYYPRVLCAPEIKAIIDKEDNTLSDQQKWNKIVEVVGTHCQMTWQMMSRRSRQRELVAARRLIVFLALLRTDFSTLTIGEKFGMDHSTIIHARDQMCIRMDADEDLRETIEFLNSQI